MTQAKTVKKQILASKIAYKRSLNNEERLERELQRFFYKLKKEVLRALDQYWSDTLLLQGQVNLIVEPVHEAHKDYYELLEKYIKREYRLGKVEGKRLVEIANSRAKTAHKSEKIPFRPYLKNRNDLFGTLPSAEERLLNKTFVASERTLSRVDSQISQILTDGYRSGEGINKVANDLTQRFDQLTTWESKRIARTEIHNAHNTAVMDSYEEYGVEYTMWMCANDDRVRDSHIEIDGEIIPMGGEYSNGLKYPGDTDGPIEEWINCRCANAPYNIPYGYMAPPFSPFRESDLVKVETKDPQQILNELETPNDNESWLDGKYELSTERDDYLKNNNTVYSFENGVDVLINDKAQFTFEEIKAHMQTLPEPLQNINPDVVKRIYIRGNTHPQMSGVFEPGFRRVQLFVDSSSKSKALDTFTHELAHAHDYTASGKLFGKGGHQALSHIDVYKPIADADNKLYKFIRPNGKERIPNKFPTDYAGRSWMKYKKEYTKRLKQWGKGSKNPLLKPEDKRYVEDFAESTRLYLNPNEHAKFVKDFPNRAKYLESLYGKPKFK